MDQQTPPNSSGLFDQFLIAMPQLEDSFFENSVIYMWQHSDEGAIGMAVNLPLAITLSELFEQLGIKDERPAGRLRQFYVVDRLSLIRVLSCTIVIPILGIPLSRWKIILVLQLPGIFLKISQGAKVQKTILLFWAAQVGGLDKLNKKLLKMPGLIAPPIKNLFSQPILVKSPKWLLHSLVLNSLN